MNIHEAIKTCLETGKSFKNEHLSITTDSGDLYLQDFVYKRKYLIRKFAQEGFEEKFVPAPSGWDMLCILAKHKEFFASRKLADGSIFVLHFSKKGVALLNGESYLPMKEDADANDWERLSNPKYRINDNVVFQGYKQEIIEIKWYQSRKVWGYVLQHFSFANGKETVEVSEKQLDYLIVTPSNKAMEVSEKLESELYPKPRYQIGEKFKSNGNGEVWKITNLFFVPSELMSHYLYNLETKDLHRPGVSELDLNTQYTKMEASKKETCEHKYNWDQMYEKLQDKQIAEGLTRTSIIIYITKKDKQLVSLNGKQFVPDREAVLANWKLYGFPKEKPKYETCDRLKEKSTLLNYVITDYHVEFRTDELSWCYALIGQGDFEAKTEAPQIFWFSEGYLDNQFVKGIAVIKKPKAKFKKGDVVVRAQQPLSPSNDRFEIKTARWDSFVNMWLYKVIDTGGSEENYLECQLVLRSEKLLVEKKPFRNPLSERPISQGIRKGYSKD